MKIGISTCLLGKKVRYDGGHAYNPWIAEALGKFVDFVPVCPEHECGMSIPREALRLVGDIEAPRLITINSKIDYTDRMQAFSKRKIQELESQQLCGFLFKSKSPSSGMERVKVYPPGGGLFQKKGVGIFAREVMNAFPLLPFEEEGRLNDPSLRASFSVRIFVMHRFIKLTSQTPKASALVDFHTKHKLLIMAHSPDAYRSLGKMVAEIREQTLPGFLSSYTEQVMKAVKHPATRARHQNVLQHILGYFKKDLTAFEKAEMLEIIERYRTGQLPLIVPITLLNHYIRKYDKPYLAQQYYLNPYPLELM